MTSFELTAEDRAQLAGADEPSRQAMEALVAASGLPAREIHWLFVLMDGLLATGSDRERGRSEADGVFEEMLKPSRVDRALDLLVESAGYEMLRVLDGRVEVSDAAVEHLVTAVSAATKVKDEHARRLIQAILSPRPEALADYPAEELLLDAAYVTVGLLTVLEPASTPQPRPSGLTGPEWEAIALLAYLGQLDRMRAGGAAAPR